MARRLSPLEDLARIDMAPFDGLEGLRVFVTGHSGFKGTWMTAVLLESGAHVVGFSLPEHNDPTNVIRGTSLRAEVEEVDGDIRDFEVLAQALSGASPDLVIHMAAQALVGASYRDPIGTIATNVLGTAHVLEAARRSTGARAILSVASDKCYENDERGRPFSESDALGGTDPYSASKGAAEIITNSFRRSLLDGDGPLLASVRAGNVVGAGDMSEGRLVPDIIRSISRNESIHLRHPEAVRPWQHVLEPIRAYLRIGQMLLKGKKQFADAWNIGPHSSSAITVAELVSRIGNEWGADLRVSHEPAEYAESETLRLDTTKAADVLGFTPKLAIDDTIRYVVEGYRPIVGGRPLGSVLREQISQYRDLVSQS